jgi:hypothetical protein
VESSDIKRLKELETKNRKLKQMFAELNLKSQLQKEIIKKMYSHLGTKNMGKSYKPLNQSQLP